MLKPFIFALGLALAACSSVTVETPEDHVFAIRSAYAATFLAPAATYSELPDCDTNPQPCSDDGVVAELQKADLAAKATLDAAEGFVRTHPDLDADAYLDAAQSALDAATQVLSIYGIGG